MGHPWWERVWSLYFPPSYQPPVLSASLISWSVSMILTGASFACAITNGAATLFVQDLMAKAKFTCATCLYVARCTLQRSVVCNKGRCVLKFLTFYLFYLLLNYRIGEALAKERGLSDESEANSICEGCSDASMEADNNNNRRIGDIPRKLYPVSYGTNWSPNPQGKFKKLIHFIYLFFIF